MPLPYQITSNERGEQWLTVILPGRAPVVVPGDHPHFEDILLEAQHDGEADEIESLADLSEAVAQKFTNLSERVAVANGRVYFDGDEIEGAITSHIVRALDFGGDFRPQVNFLEKVAANPSEHSREQLYDWLDAHDFTITREGDIVGYKGVAKDGDENLVSVNQGSAIVDGETVTGRIPNEVGSTVEMPRSSVAFNPAESCSTGLHVGTYDYAQGWAQGAMLKVAVSPRDVVSVPTDAGGEKVRVCRYIVLEVIDAPEATAVSADEGYDDEELDDEGYSSPW